MTQQLVNQDTPCTCYCCQWDQARMARMGSGKQPFDPPDMPMYSAAQLLECECFMSVGPVRYDNVQAADFWRVFGGHLRDWLREAVVSERIVEPEPAKYGATSLLLSIEFGGFGPVARKPYEWAPLGGKELLRGVADGLLSGWDERVVVDGLSSFLLYLGRVGAIDGHHAQAVHADLAARTPQFLRAMQRR